MKRPSWLLTADRLQNVQPANLHIYFFRRKAGHEYKNYLKHKSYQQNQLDR